MNNEIVKLRVVQTGKRRAFDIVQGAPDYQIRHKATAVFVQYKNLRKEGRIRTYANDIKPFGPTIRHFRNISEQFIDVLHLSVGQEYDCILSILPDKSHIYELVESEPL